MFERIFLTRSLTLSLLLIISTGVSNVLAENFNIDSGQQTQVGLRHSLVCMANDTYMSKEQIPVEVEGKIYYGCCKGCEENLKKNRQMRYAKDLATGKEVDKATAYIAKLSEQSNEVSYFESRGTYETFVHSIHGTE